MPKAREKILSLCDKCREAKWTNFRCKCSLKTRCKRCGGKLQGWSKRCPSCTHKTKFFPVEELSQIEKRLLAKRTARNL